MKLTRQILMLITCIVVMAVAAIQKDGKLFGHEFGKEEGQVAKTEKKVEVEAEADSVVKDSTSEASAVNVLEAKDDGTMVVNTTDLCKDVEGFAGPVPMEITIKDGTVEDVTALPNDETPEFFEEAKVIAAQWKGKSLQDAMALEVDVVTGATFSSKAIINNVREGLAYAVANMPDTGADEIQAAGGDDRLTAKFLVGLIVVLMGAVIPLLVRDKTMRMMQLILNVVVLGLWCGSFLNYTLFLRALSHGLDVWAYLIPIFMLIVAFIYPLFGKKQHYCTHICPFGSLQDLAGKCTSKKLRISHNTLRVLNWFRQGLWIVLMALMILGLYFDWINYELFTAFIIKAASIVVILLAIVFTILAVFIPRPYCRFVCPTGTLIKVAEGRF